jgi:hypothetical protein
VVRALISGDAEGLAPRPGGGPITRAGLIERGLATREIDELIAKLQPATRPDFELDMTQAKPPSEFESRFAAAVPQFEAKPQEG